MINLKIKAKFNSAKASLKNKFQKLKTKINRKKDKINEVKVNTFLGYSSVILVGGLLVSMNIFNFMVCLSVKYPELNISMYKHGEIASVEQANILIQSNQDKFTPDTEEIIITKPKYSTGIIAIKAQYKSAILNKSGDTIDSITVEKKEDFIAMINDTLVRLNSLSIEDSDEIEKSTAKLLALKEILDESIETNNNSEEETIDLTSAEEKNKETNKPRPVSVSALPVAKEEIKIEPKVIVEAPVVKVEPKVIVEAPVVKVEPKIIPEIIIKIPIVEEKPVVIIAPVIKEEPKIIIKAPVIKEEVKVEPKIIIEAPVIEEEPKLELEVADESPVVKEENPRPVSGSDTISNNLNTEVNRLLTNLNADIFNSFKLKVSKNDNIFLENGVRYTYVYSKYKNFGKGVIPSEADLQRSGLDKNTSVLLLNDTIGASFLVDYKKVKLISDSIIVNITNKHEFLTQLIHDKKYLHDDTDSLFISLKSTTLNLTNGATRDSKIVKIYDYILRNTNYSAVFSIDNKAIFSGIYTYKNKDGICGGYSKLNLYMLSFAGVPDARVIKGNVIDASDFPAIGHAWIQIGYQYYDPTFDDPSGAVKTKTYSEYKYFGLPKDLFYTNRFDYGTLPEYLKTDSLYSRKTLIKENLSKLVDKYETRNYVLLNPLTFRKNNNLTSSEVITIEKLKNIIPSFEANAYKYTDKDGSIKTITNIDYYTVNDANIEILLEQVNYNLDGYTLFKWDDGTYRMAYSLSVR